MKGRQVIIGRVNGDEAAALMQDGQLIDLILEPKTLLAPGTICRGVTERLLKGQGGIFVRLPDGQRGYLRERSGISEGKPMLVQVTGIGEDQKAIPLTSRIMIRGRYSLVTPGAPGVNVSRRIRETETREMLEELGQKHLGERDHGLILRSAAELASAEEISAELEENIVLTDRLLADSEGAPELLLETASPWEQAWMEWADPPPDAVEEGDDSFDEFGVSDALDALLSPHLSLPNGASAYIESTRALIAVDVNTGSDTSPAAALKANIALSRDLPRQLRLRGLGGQVIIDFAPIPKRDRVTLDQVLKAAFKGDGTETTLVGWTTMGLYEINRKRDRIPLPRLLERT